MSPGCARRFRRWTDCSQGDLPIIWPACLPLRSIRTCVSHADLRPVEGELVRVDPRLQPLQPLVHDFARDLVLHRCRRSARPGAVFERISRGVADRIDDLQRRLEILFGLAGEADDEVAAKWRCRGARRASSRVCEIGFGRVAAVHRLEDAVAARLHRQVEVGHQLVDLAMGGDQRVGHVGGMAGGVADPLEPIDRRQRADQLGEAAALRRVQAFTFWPSRTISRAPASTSACASATMSLHGREISAPRV